MPLLGITTGHLILSKGPLKRRMPDIFSRNPRRLFSQKHSHSSALKYVLNYQKVWTPVQDLHLRIQRQSRQCVETHSFLLKTPRKYSSDARLVTALGAARVVCKQLTKPEDFLGNDTV